MVLIASGGAGDDAVRSRKTVIRLVLTALVIGAAVVAAFALGLPERLSLDGVRAQRAGLEAFVAAHPVGSVALYCAIYVAVVGLSLPGALVMSLTGGFLFGPLVGTAAGVGSVTAGSLVMFFVARTTLGAGLARRFGDPGGLLARIESAATRHPFSTILSFRLIPAVPIFLVNLGAGAVRTPLLPFTLATVLGVIPSTFLYCSVGAGLDHLFDEVEPEALMGVIRSELALPALGLCGLAILPLALQWWRGRRVAERRELQ